MSQALRERIDATEAFAADVAHELKNPLASLRSAIDSLDRVSDPELRARLVAIIHDDVIRLDRLISDISEASRLDAELSRARFEPVDMGVMVYQLVQAREARGLNGGIQIAYARPRKGSAMVNGEGARLARAIENLLSNAVSFSPPDGLVKIACSSVDGDVIIRIEDDGPGVPLHTREKIFDRFHSIRPEGEEFGKHSGLGLAIARTIVTGHDGRISVQDRDDGQPGACFVVRLPALVEP
jgi:two-component system sensor histidine kinase ChvG